MTRTTELFSTADGVKISLDWYRHGGGEPAVIICPGFFQSKETKTFQRMAQALATTRDVLAMDFRGHGRSSGLYTFSAREGADLEAVLSWAAERYQQLGIVGFSMGGAIAINTVSRHPERVRTLVAVSAPSSFEEVEFRWWTPEAMRTGIQGMESGAGCRPGNLFLKKERAIDTVRNLSQVPLLFIHGTRDVIVDAQHSHRLYAAAPEPKRLHIIQGGSHAHALFRDAPDRFTRLVNSWLDETLPTAEYVVRPLKVC